MSSLAAVGVLTPKAAPSASKAASDGGAAFGPALTLARGLLDPPAVRPGSGSHATPGPARPIDLAATTPTGEEAAVAASGAVPEPVPGLSLGSTPVGPASHDAGDTPDGAGPLNQTETGTIPSGSALALRLPEDRAAFLSRAAQGARVEASAAPVPTGLPALGGEQTPPPAVTAPGAVSVSGADTVPGSVTAPGGATAATPVAGSQAPSASAASAQAAPAQATPAQAAPAVGAPTQAAPTQPAPPVPGAGAPRSATPAAEPSAAALQPVVPAAQPSAPQPAALPTAATALPAPAASVPTVPLATQLYKPVFSLAGASKGEHLITVRVAPDEFGPVTVRALVTAEGMRVELFAPTEAAREALRGMLPDLRRDLAAPGLHASLDVSTKDQPGSGDSASGDADGQGPARQDPGRPDRTREPPAPPGRPADSPSPEESGLPGGTSWNRSTLDLLA